MSNSLANLNFFLNTQKISKTLRRLCCLSYNVPIMPCYMYLGFLLYSCNVSERLDTGIRSALHITEGKLSVHIRSDM